MDDKERVRGGNEGERQDYESREVRVRCLRAPGEGRGEKEVRVRERGLGGPFRRPPATGTAPGLPLICRLDRLV